MGTNRAVSTEGSLNNSVRSMERVRARIDNLFSVVIDYVGRRCDGLGKPSLWVSSIDVIFIMFSFSIRSVC